MATKEIVCRMAGKVLDYLRKEKIYAMTYGSALMTTYAAQKYNHIKYDRDSAIFEISKNDNPPKSRELTLTYTPLRKSLDTYKEPTLVELQYYAKHPSKTFTIPNEDDLYDLDKFLNNSYFAEWDYKTIIKRLQRIGFKSYSGGMYHADMDLEALVLNGNADQTGTLCKLKVKVEEKKGVLTLDLRIK